MPKLNVHLSEIQMFGICRKVIVQLSFLKLTMDPLSSPTHEADYLISNIFHLSLDRCQEIINIFFMCL